MTKYKVGTIIWGIFSGIFLITLLTNLGNPSAVVPIAIVLGFSVLLLLINILMFNKSKSPEYQEKIKQKNPLADAKCSVFGNLVSGLNLPEKTQLSINLFSDKIKIVTNYGNNSANQTFELPLEKVTNAFILSEQQVQQIVSQSAPGMVIGAAAFGILGAMVGGRVKTKEKRTMHFFFGIDYTSNGENCQVIIDVGEWSVQANKFIKELNKVKPLENTTVQL